MTARRTAARLAITLAVSVVAILAVTAPASGRAKAKAQLKVESYEFKFQRLHGHLYSSTKRCENDRRVVLWRRDPAGGRNRVGADETDRVFGSGSWQVSIANVPGTYFATVKRKVVHRHGDPLVCEGDRSGNFTHSGV